MCFLAALSFFLVKFFTASIQASKNSYLRPYFPSFSIQSCMLACYSTALSAKLLGDVLYAIDYLNSVFCGLSLLYERVRAPNVNLR